jgi:phage minor structural protein
MAMIFILDKQLEVRGVLNNETPEACPYYADEHLEQIDDGVETYTFSVPANHELVKDEIKTEAYVVFKGYDDIYRLYQIKEVLLDKDDSSVYNVISEQSAISDLTGEIIRPQTLEAYNAEQSLHSVLQTTDWKVGNVGFFGVQTMDFQDYPSSLKAVRDIAKTYGGELRFRIEFDGTRILGKYIDLLPELGENRGKILEYEKDIKGLRRTEDSTELITAVIGLGKADENGHRMTMANTIWSNAEPDRKPNGQDWIGDEEALRKWSPNGRHIFGIYDNPELTSAHSIMERSWDYLQTRNKPRFTYEVDVVLLGSKGGYEHEETFLGDTVTVRDFTFSPALILEARVIEVRRSYTEPQNDSVILGEFNPLFVDSSDDVAAIKDLINRKSGQWEQGGGETIYKGNTPPPSPSDNMLWLNTSVEPNQLHRYDETRSLWIYATPTKAGDIGAETPEGALSKAQQEAQAAQKAAEAHANRAAETAQEAAESYALAQAEAERIKAESYADGIVTEEEQARIEQAEANLTAAKSHAQTQAANALEAAETFANSAAGNAQTAAELYAKAEAEAERLKAEAYADGIVSAEELARIEQAKKDLAEAKRHANEQTQAATVAAQQYADTAATAAQTAAEKVAKKEAELAEARAKAHADGILTADELAQIENLERELQQVRQYADGKASDAQTAAQTYADTAATNARQAAEAVAVAQAEAARIAAEAHADSVITDEEHARIAQAEKDLAAAKAHANQAASNAEQAAKAHATNAANAAQTAAEAVAAAKATLAETNAKAHADGVVDAEERARIEQAKKDLAAAKAHAENKATAAENAAKTHAETKAAAAETAAKNHANSKAQAARVAAEAYAKAQAAAERVKAESYADGKVTAEEKARIADANAKLADAKKHADNKAQAAETAARNYASSTATAAETAAKNYAKAQAEAERVKAESYADGKITAEERARIADANAKLADAKKHADSKATAAQNAAKSYTEGWSKKGADKTSDNAAKATVIPDTRSLNSLPSWYRSNYSKQVVTEFKSRTALGIGASTYGVLTTKVGWTDSSGGPVVQTYDNNGVIYHRRSNSGDTGWLAWTTVEDEAGAKKKADDAEKRAKDHANAEAKKAKDAADNAKSAADGAQSTANGKNTVFYQSSTPSTSGRRTGDVWFHTGSHYRMYRWTGSAWSATQFGANAISNLAITNAKIANGAIDSAKISNLDAGKITVGTLKGVNISGVNITGSTFSVKETMGGLTTNTVIDSGGYLTEVDITGRGDGWFAQIIQGFIYLGDLNRNVQDRRLTIAPSGITAKGSFDIDSPKLKLTGGNVIEFTGGSSIDTAGGYARWRQSNSNYIRQDPNGDVHIYGSSSVRHSFRANGDITLRGDGELENKVHAFLSLRNGWQDYNASTGSFQQARYTKSGDGFVHLSGLVRRGTMNQALAVLPVGCRPYKVEIFTVDSNGAHGAIRVYPNGNIIPTNGNNSWQSLGGISFRAEN